MMEATKHNPGFWLVVVLLCINFSAVNSLFAQANEPDALLTQLLDSAEILKLKGKFYDAEVICKQTQKEAERIGDWTNVARSLNDLANIRWYHDENDACRELLNEAHEIIKIHLDTAHVEMARNYLYRGKLQKYLAIEADGYPKNAFSSYFNAEKIMLNIEGYSEELAAVLMDLWRLYDKLDSLNQARAYVKKLEDLLNEDFDHLDYYRGFHLSYLSRYYNSVADYERGSLYSSLASQIFGHPSNNDVNRLLQSRIMQANLIFHMKRYESAIPIYKQVLNIANLAKQRNYANILSATTNTGVAYLRIDKIDSSIFYAKKAISINQGETYDDKEKLSYSLRCLGEAYAIKGDQEKSDQFFKKGLDLNIEINGEQDHSTHAYYRIIGKSYQKRQLLDEALKYYQEALIALFPEFNSKVVYENPRFDEYEKKEDVLYILTDKAEALYSRYLQNNNPDDLKAAYSLYANLYVLTDDLLNSGMMDASMIQLFNGFSEAFNLSVECTFDLYQLTDDQKYFRQGFQFIEKSRYILLSRALTNSTLKQNNRVSATSFLEERQLNHDINRLKFMINNSSNHEEKFNLQNTLFENLLKYAQVNNQIKSMVDVAIGPQSYEMLTIEELQTEIIKDNEMILEYKWAKNFIYALAILKDDVDVHKIKITAELKDKINDYSQCISGRSTDSNEALAYDRFTTSAYFLFKNLVAPIILNANKKNESVNHITIIPDGVLSFLPFEAFLTSVPENTDSANSYWGLPYLLNEFTFRYAYSLNILKSGIQANKKINQPNLLAMSYSADIDLFDSLSLSRSQNELRYSAEELNSIQSMFDYGSYYEDELATEELFKQNVSNYSLIHLALHGQADDSDIYNSKLLFKDDISSSEDGELHAFELYNLNLSNSEMVVLSACETGIGQQTEGEGIFSIARGFAYAGCPSIFMSLWKVSDKTTARLMKHFYANLKEGMPKDKALQDAKIKYINSSEDHGAHPTYWAAFIAMGNTDPIQMPAGFIKWYYALALLILVILGWFSLKSKKRKARS